MRIRTFAVVVGLVCALFAADVNGSYAQQVTPLPEEPPPGQPVQPVQPIEPLPTDLPAPEPPTPTNTPLPEPPTPTNTPLPEPPTATNTPVPEPPTATNTPLPEPPTPTNTPLPEPPTPTNTPLPEPPTATNTPLPEPPTPSPTPTTAAPTATPTTPTPGAPAVRIVDPPPGAVINTSAGVQVSGRAENLFENTVVVRIVDANGGRLSERATTANTQGRWSVMLPVPPVTTAATIIAYSQSPADGSIMAQDRVSISLRAPPGSTPTATATAAPTATPTRTPPRPPAIEITQPTSGARVDISAGLVTAGIARDVFENNVVVEIRDQSNRMLAQTATTAASNGVWAASFNLVVPDGTTGIIRAYSRSPLDGSIMAEDTVRVTFVSPCRVRTDWPIYVVQRGDTLFSIAAKTGSTVSELTAANCLANPNLIEVGQQLHVPNVPSAPPPPLPPEVAIVSPEPSLPLPLDAPAVITGTSRGTLPGSVRVRLMDAMGVVLAEESASVVAKPDANGEWQWQATFTRLAVEVGEQGTAYAYVPRPDDGSTEARAAQPVLFGADTGAPFILITSPLPYTTLSGDQVVVVRGLARDLFEGNLVVRAIDDRGIVLAEQIGVAGSPQPGTAVPWEVVLEVPGSARGRIIAYSPSPVDGSWMTSAGQTVRFGDPRQKSSYVDINFPLPDTLITNRDLVLAVAGYADGVFPEAVSLFVLDETGFALYSVPLEVDPATGVWNANTARSLTIQNFRGLSLLVVASAPDGSVIAQDRILVRTSPEGVPVSGSIVTETPEALPAGSQLTVRIVNASLADAPPEMTILAETVVTDPGGFPLAFELDYDPAKLNPNVIYSISAQIRDAEGALLYTSTTMTPVITLGNPSEDVVIQVDRIAPVAVAP